MVTAQSMKKGPYWRKAMASTTGGCVEVASVGNGMVGVRDSKDRGGPILRYTTQEWAAFLTGVRQGEFSGLADF